MAKLFGDNKLRELAAKMSASNFAEELEIIRAWHNDFHNGTLKADKETSREQAYNQAFFVRILGYAEKPTAPFTLEPKSSTDFGQLPDVRLGYFDSQGGIENTAAVVELKDASTSLDRPQRRDGNLSPVQQGFKYKPQYVNCPFVVVSNFFELRLYNNNQLDFEVWTLDDLVDPAEDYLAFKTFYLLLRRENLTSALGKSVTENLLLEIRSNQEEIGHKFYADYTEARQALISSLWLKNDSVKENPAFGVQMAQKILDRMVFACFAEDRGLLPDFAVQNMLRNAEQSSFGGLWGTFKGFFEAIDRGSDQLEIPVGYNGGLFREDPALNRLNVGSPALHKVAALSNYNFKEDLSVTILGHIFEQSISDLEELRSSSSDHEALGKVSDSQRKREGIFYTPDHIVRHIVDTTLGAYLREIEARIVREEGLHQEISDANYAKRERTAYRKYQNFLTEVRVLDPACGSGAFLVQVFDFLLAENKRIGAILDDLSLNDTYVKQILEQNIYGVDLNEESVEITRLSLWLKSADKGKKLTALDETIKCGNSLVEDSAVDPGRNFKWGTAFPAVTQAGGFDAVVGNPPWIFARGGNFKKIEKTYFYRRFKLSNYQLNTYLMFLELSYELLRQGGRLGMIVPNTCLTISTFRPFRVFLLEEVGDVEVVNIFGSVFSEASVDSCMLSFSKRSPTTLSLAEMSAKQLAPVGVFDPATLAKGDFIINISVMKNQALVSVLDTIAANSQPLGAVADVKVGLKAYQTGKGSPTQSSEVKAARIFHSTARKDDRSERYLQGRDVIRYLIDWSGQWLEYGPHLAEPRKPALFVGPRLLVRQIPNRPPHSIHAAYTDSPFYNDLNSNIVQSEVEDLRFLLGVMNSKATSFWFLNTFDKLQRGVFPQFKIGELKQFPIPTAGDEDRTQLVLMVEKMIALRRDFLDLDRMFWTVISTEIPGLTPSRLSGRWWEGNFADFIANIVPKPSLAVRARILEFFEQQRDELIVFAEDIATADTIIDRIVYGLFGLSFEETELIELALSEQSTSG
jgi:type I restriction-modification system DNA methylase subunit